MKISQREARRLKARCEAYERAEDQRRNAWCLEYPGGAHIATVTSAEAAAKIHVARLLKHAVVVTTYGERLEFRALPLGSRS